MGSQRAPWERMTPGSHVICPQACGPSAAVVEGPMDILLEGSLGKDMTLEGTQGLDSPCGFH